MKKKIFTFLFALLASTTLYANGIGDGSTPADAIEYDWEQGVIHYGDARPRWYRLDLSPLYERADTLLFSISNQSSTESVDVTCLIMDYMESSTQTLAPQSSYDVWKSDSKILVKENQIEIFFLVSSTGNVQLTWQLTQRTGDSCEEAQYGFWQQQEAGTKWYAIYEPYFGEGVNIDSLVISFRNWAEETENNISVSFKTDCDSPAFDSQTFTIEPYSGKDIAFPAEFLAALGWPEIVFSCTCSSSCEIFPSYYVRNTGERCELPIDLAGDTIKYHADPYRTIERWYRLELDETDIPETYGLRLHFANTSTEVNNFTAGIYYDCNEPEYISENFQLAPDEDTYIDIHREILHILGKQSLLMEYTSDKDSRIWVETRHLYRDTIFMDTTIYVCPGNIIFYDGGPVVKIMNDTTWSDTVSIIKGLAVMDSIIRFHAYILKLPEALSIEQMKTMGAAPSLIQGMPLDVATSNALLTRYYRNSSYQEEKYAFTDTVYWAEPVYKEDGSLDEYKEAPLNLISPYTSSDFEDTLLLVIVHECDITRIPYIFPVKPNRHYITVAEALAIGNKLEVGAYTPEQYTIRGYVSSIKIPYNEKYGNQSFYIADDIASTAGSNEAGGFYVYRGKPETGEAIKTGTFVEITAAIYNYNGINIENYEQNIPVVIIEEAPECFTLSGACGNNLVWELTCDSVLTINGTGAMWRLTEEEVWRPYKERIKTAILPEGMDSIAPNAFYQCINLTSVNLPNSVRAVGHKAFVGCDKLTGPVYNDRIFAYLPSNYSDTTYFVPEGIVAIAAYAISFVPPTDVSPAISLPEIVLPSSLKRMGTYSMGCFLKKITCYAATPPECAANVFACLFEDVDVTVSIDKSIPVYVPAESIEAYKSADQWKEFINILPIAAQETEAIEVTTTTTAQTVDITWPSVAGAYTYELVIKDKEGNVICTLIFNSNGQLTQIVFNAPSRDGAPQHTQAAGFTFTVTGLEAGTSYDLTITAKGENGQELDKQNVSFHTDDTQAIEDIHTGYDKPVKVLMDGKIYILRGEHVYDAQGKMVK